MSAGVKLESPEATRRQHPNGLGTAAARSGTRSHAGNHACPLLAAQSTSPKWQQGFGYLPWALRAVALQPVHPRCETNPPAHVHLCCSFETFPLFSAHGRMLPISLPVHPRWKVTAHGTQPDSLILLAPPNSLCPKALKLQTLPCSLPRLPRCEVQHLPLS